MIIQPIFIQDRLNKGFSRIQNAPRGIKTCKCTIRFLVEKPGQDKCRGCETKATRVHFETMRAIAKAVRSLNERLSEQSGFARSIKAQWHAKALPSDAKETRKGRQVIVCCAGRSVTFYTK